jgi:hypothetical protein
MSLYLVVFDHDREASGWVFGHYSDFAYFRDTVARTLDAHRYPVLMTHSDSDGAWDLAVIPTLEQELMEISKAFKGLPASELRGAFEHTAKYRRSAKNLWDCFQNVAGENLFEAMIQLCRNAQELASPILFQ